MKMYPMIVAVSAFLFVGCSSTVEVTEIESSNAASAQVESATPCASKAAAQCEGKTPEECKAACEAKKAECVGKTPEECKAACEAKKAECVGKGAAEG